MNVKEFFDLTRKVRAAQKTYYKSRLQGDLIVSKQLESQLDKAIDAVVKGVPLEPDELPAAVTKLTEDEYKEYMRLVNQHQIELQLELSGSQRPTDGQGGNI